MSTFDKVRAEIWSFYSNFPIRKHLAKGCIFIDPKDKAQYMLSVVACK